MNILSLINSIKDIKHSIIESLELIEYKKTPAYINKVLKSEQGLKNKGEVVIYLTPEKKYNKFTSTNIELEDTLQKKHSTLGNNTTRYMTIFEKWIYFLFNTK